MHETFLNSDGKDHKESADCRRFFSGVSHLLYMPSSKECKNQFLQYRPGAKMGALHSFTCPDKLKDPFIRCFYENNPDYARGNEIPVISRITPDNLKVQEINKA